VSSTMPLGWMMIKKKKGNDAAAGGLLLLFFLLLMHLTGSTISRSHPGKPPLTENVFIRILGDVAHPGVYTFERPPDLGRLIIQAGGLDRATEEVLAVTRNRYESGEEVCVRSDGSRLHISKGDMSAFYRFTLGIPISLNIETQKGLTAIPGIGPKTADAIIRARTKRSGFGDLNELLSVPGIGPTLLKKMYPYLSVVKAESEILP